LNDPSPALLLTVDLGALVRNWRAMADLSAPAECAAVVKADAYGIGVDRAAPALAAAGAKTFFVALPEEGARLRAALAQTSAPDADIYVLNGMMPDWAEIFRAHMLRPVLGTLESVTAWASLCPGAPSALHVDTGMNRLGLSVREALELASDAALLDAVAPRLVMSHLACADEREHPLNHVQLERFREVRAAFPKLPASLANSAGIALGRDFHFDLVRPGIALYGAAYARDTPPLENIVTLQARVLQVRDVPAGETVGYGAEKRVTSDSRVAILAAGYADGFLRAGGSSDSRPGGRVWLRGSCAPLLGRVSMDLIAVDVSRIVGVVEGDLAELIGPNMPIDEVATAAGTISYELLTGLSRRATRIYLGASPNPLPEKEGVTEGDG
jgi:alanine racemase